MISIKLSVNDVAAKGNVDFKSFESWSKKPPKRPKVLNIRVFLFQCRDIPSSDDDGNSDCYIKIWNSDNKEMRTRTVHDTLNPIFYEVFDVAHEFTVLKDAPPIILNLWDENGTLEHDKYLGRCLLYLNQAASNKLDGTDDYDFSEDAVN
jgi:Ca2+-dependent lipid-binding protein